MRSPKLRRAGARELSTVCLLIVASAVSGCATTGARSGPRGAAGTIATAGGNVTSALRLWADFPVDAAVRPIVLTGPNIMDPMSGFPDGDAKLAYLSGGLDLATALPTVATTQDGRRVISASEAFSELRAMGKGNQPSPQRLSVTQVRLGNGMFSTDRGLRPLPAWSFTFAGVAQPAWVLAVPPADLWPRPGMPDPMHRPAGLTAMIAPDGRHVTIGFGGSHPGTGPCQAEYTAHVTQSDQAVSVSITALPNPNNPPSTACAAASYGRSLTISLTPALGNRVLISTNGSPAPAYSH